MGSSRTGARTRVPCIGRRTLNHCATREARSSFLEARCPGLCLIDTKGLGMPREDPGLCTLREGQIILWTMPASPGARGCLERPEGWLTTHPLLPLFPDTCSVLRTCSQHHTSWESKPVPGVPLPGKAHIRAWPSCAFRQSSWCRASLPSQSVPTAGKLRAAPSCLLRAPLFSYWGSSRPLKP